MKWYSPDILKRIELGARYVCDMLDADHDNMPYFYIERREDGTVFGGSFGKVMEMDLPQVTGRAIDTLYYAEEFAGYAIPHDCDEAYTRHLLGCFDNEYGLPSLPNPDAPGKIFLDGHSMREDLEGLTWLIRRRGNQKAREYADRMLRVLRSVTDDNTGLSPELVRDKGMGDIFLTIGDIQTINSGRLVGALVKYYRLTGSLLALELAGIYSRNVIQHSFSKEGLITDNAWYHIHSITSTLSGVLDYALMVNAPDLVESVQRVYEVGLREFYSTYGWVLELAWLETNQGEVNQIGDLIQVQLILAAHRDPRYYAQAETWMRSALMPSQVLDDSFAKNSPNPKGDFERDMKERMIGGFGFPTPTAHLKNEDSRVNTVDITQGAVQAMCEFTRYIIAESDLGIQVNLLFTWENELAKVESSLPEEGRLRIQVKKPSNLIVRIPERIVDGSLRVECGGEVVTGIRQGVYIVLPNEVEGTVFDISFNPERFDRSEYVYHKLYNVSWFGEQAIGISPVTGIYPLFGEWPCEGE
ncbi:MAG: hypothetical protein ACYC27_07615 [Armatimonadota bacterium]